MKVPYDCSKFYAGTRMQFSELDTHLPPERQEMRQKSNRVTPGKFVRSFDWSSVRALKTTRMACFGRGGVEKSIKQSKFSPAPTAGVFAIKTIHSKVFSELLHLPWLLGQLAFYILLGGC